MKTVGRTLPTARSRFAVDSNLSRVLLAYDGNYLRLASTITALTCSNPSSPDVDITVGMLRNSALLLEDHAKHLDELFRRPTSFAVS